MSKFGQILKRDVEWEYLGERLQLKRPNGKEYVNCQQK